MLFSGFIHTGGNRMHIHFGAAIGHNTANLTFYGTPTPQFLLLFHLNDITYSLMTKQIEEFLLIIITIYKHTAKCVISPTLQYLNMHFMRLATCNNDKRMM